MKLVHIKEVMEVSKAYNRFDMAARNLKERYIRRFPEMADSVDLTTIKDRWYRRGTCHFVRTRLA